MDNIPRSRMRLRFARRAAAGNISHLEQIRELRRIASLSGLDLCPARFGGRAVPKMAFGPALPAGCGSRCEYADLYLAQNCAESAAAARISAVASEHMELLSVKRVPVHFPSIEACAGAAQYLMETGPGEMPSRASLDAFLAMESVPLLKKDREGEDRTVDVRPLVLEASLDGAAGAVRLRLKLDPGRNAKPAEILSLIAGREVPVRRLEREELFWIDSKGVLEII